MLLPPLLIRFLQLNSLILHCFFTLSLDFLVLCYEFWRPSEWVCMSKRRHSQRLSTHSTCEPFSYQKAFAWPLMWIQTSLILSVSVFLAFLQFLLGLFFWTVESKTHVCPKEYTVERLEDEFPRRRLTVVFVLIVPAKLALLFKTTTITWNTLKLQSVFWIQHSELCYCFICSFLCWWVCSFKSENFKDSLSSKNS